MLNSDELRKIFIDYFVERNHKHISSSSLIPYDDPTLLFTTAGMVQIKPYWSGSVPVPYKRTTTCQKCLRVSGKGSDLENVGKTLRHHTFFEMLGNFSFGDYFKKEAIEWAWDFTINVVKMPIDKLYVSIYEDDDEAFDIWHTLIGLSKDRIVRLGAKDNFWGPAGESGACGPCSELHIDLGVERSCGKSDCYVGCDCERYLEFWNLVFPQYDQQPDGSRPILANRGIDTGMSLERLAMIVQGSNSLYENDIMLPIVNKVCELIGIDYYKDSQYQMSINVIADHIRALTFTINEGVIPSNEGRGYVMRRILRRAVRHCKKIGVMDPFIYKTVDTVVERMGKAYPELKENPKRIEEIVKLEEERFHKTIDKGLKMLDSHIKQLKDEGKNLIDGKFVFELYDTYGFPVDLTYEIADENGLKVDEEGFQKNLDSQKELARKSWKGAELIEDEKLFDDMLEKYGPTQFFGYETLFTKSEIVCLVKDKVVVNSVKEGDPVEVVVKETPFYAEAGGQVGDIGFIETDEGYVEIGDVQKTAAGIYRHFGKVTKGNVKVHTVGKCSVDENNRLAIARNHSATHLLQAALRQVLGTHIKQSGSYVSAKNFRFDFTHNKAVPKKDLEKVEKIVSDYIISNLNIEKMTLPIDEAKEMGAVAPFGEKYGEVVRVIKMGDESLEFCGGTHLENTSQVGQFIILNEYSVAAGIRRIEGITGDEAFKYNLSIRHIVDNVTKTLSVGKEEIADRLKKLVDENKELKKEIDKIHQKDIQTRILEEIPNKKEKIGKAEFFYTEIPEMKMNDLRNLSDITMSHLPSGISIIATKGAKLNIVIGVSKTLSGEINASEVAKLIGKELEGSGGGKPTFAQAGGKNPEKLPEAINKAKEFIKKKLS